jgi:hypothetical protein
MKGIFHGFVPETGLSFCGCHPMRRFRAIPINAHAAKATIVDCAQARRLTILFNA